MAVAVSVVLLALFLGTHSFHSFNLGMLDIIFILLPVGILGVKCLLELLLAPESGEGENFDAMNYLASFFRPLVKIFRDWFPFLLLSACYYALYNNLVLKVNPHLADPMLSKIDAVDSGQSGVVPAPALSAALAHRFSLFHLFLPCGFFPGRRVVFLPEKGGAGVPAHHDGFPDHHADGNHQLHPSSGCRPRNIFCGPIHPQSGGKHH